ncbi:MAG: heparan-alpha-glucosaminide N-acetyltransferase domain-containing protein [Planctomycetota bacterium]
MSDTTPKTAGRLQCLDAFRGFDIAAMLLVNMTWNRDVFHPQLFHIDYNAPAQGATFTDLVFPWFLFIAGCAIPLSMRSGRGRSMSGRRKILIALRRGAIIYLLGVLLTVTGKAYDSPLTWKDWFGWNILQLIGTAYVCAVLAYMLPKKAQIGLVFGVLAAKLATLTLIPADAARAAMDAAGLAPRVAGGEFTGPGTFTHFDDVKRLLHLEHVKAGLSRDDAGFLQSFAVYVAGWFGMAQQFLPCAAIAVAGGWCAEILTNNGKEQLQGAVRLLVFGAALTAAGYLLQAGYSPSGGGWLGVFTVPFSKWLFSPSYCLLAAGTGAILLGLFYLVTDVFRVTSLTPLRVFGANALALYVGAELSFKVIFNKWQIVYPNGHGGAIAGGCIAWCTHWGEQLGLGTYRADQLGGACFVLAWLGVWWLFCWWLWRRQIVIRV